MKLIGLVGHAGSGKNTFAEEFHYSGYREYSFAGPLKDACAAAFGISRELFDHPLLKNEPLPFWGVTPREMMQFVGTEMFREHSRFLLNWNADVSFWVKRLEYQLIKDYDCTSDVKAVVTDCRFRNEIDFILSNQGVIIHLTRPGHDGTVGIQGHASESFVSQFLTHYEVDNEVIYSVENSGSLEELKHKARLFAANLFKS